MRARSPSGPVPTGGFVIRAQSTSVEAGLRRYATTAFPLSLGTLPPESSAAAWDSHRTTPRFHGRFSSLGTAQPAYARSGHHRLDDRQADQSAKTPCSSSRRPPRGSCWSPCSRISLSSTTTGTHSLTDERGTRTTCSDRTSITSSSRRRLSTRRSRRPSEWRASVPYAVGLPGWFLLSAALLFVYIRQPRGGMARAGPASFRSSFAGNGRRGPARPFQIFFFGSMACGLGALLAIEGGGSRRDLLACTLLAVSFHLL